LAHDLLVQSRLVAAELIRERHNDSRSVRSHQLRTEGRSRNRLLIRLGNPLSLRLPGDDVYRDTGPGKIDPLCELEHGRSLVSGRPNFRRLLRVKSDTARSAVHINTSHRWPPLRLKTCFSY